MSDTPEALPEEKDARHRFDVAAKRLYGGDVALRARHHSLVVAGSALPPGNDHGSLLAAIAKGAEMSTDAMRAALEQLSFVFVNEGETAAEAIRRVRDVAREALAQPASELVAWVSVSTRLPEPDTPVLVHNGSWTGVGAWRSGDLEPTERWQDEHSEFIEHLGPAVTHWMPLPAGPAARAALAQPASAEPAENAAPRERPCVRACKGIPRVGCNYLAECGGVCNKCGEVHPAKTPPSATGFDERAGARLD